MSALLFRLVPAGVLGVALILPAGAQQNPGNAPTMSEDCRVDPPKSGSDGSIGQQEPADKAESSGGKSLRETLEPCDGVLAPPRVGDEDLTAAPPEAGNTPIIDPEELPPQRPAQ